MALDFLHDLEPDGEQEIIALSARFWALADSDLPNGFAMIEMAEILQKIAEAADSLPTIIVRRLRPDPVNFDVLRVAYLAENFWMSTYLRFNDEKSPYSLPSYSEKRYELKGGKTDQLEARNTDEAGKGLYAREKIQKGDPIFVCSGRRKIFSSPYESREIVEKVHDGKRRFSLRPRNPDQLFLNAICIGQEDLEPMVGLRIENPKIKANVWLDPSPTSPLRFLNHSCEPNIKRTRDALTFVAMRDLSPNEQLTCDYSTVEVNPDWQMECKCGSAHCRGLIGSIQSLPEELLDTYSRDLPQFMLDLFRESHPDIDRDVHDTISTVRRILGRHLPY